MSWRSLYPSAPPPIIAASAIAADFRVRPLNFTLFHLRLSLEILLSWVPVLPTAQYCVASDLTDQSPPRFSSLSHSGYS